MNTARDLRWGGLLLLVALGVGEPVLLGQTETPKVSPYASMNPDKVEYRGPGRGKNNDFQGAEVRIGLLLPLKGKGAPEGKLLLQAAQIAVDLENRAEPPGKGQRFVLAVEDESGQWGQASNAMARLILQEQSVALITSLDGNIAHQAEQIANKIGIVVVTLSSDASTTRINIPWIFRVGTSDSTQAQLMVERIYGAGKQPGVLLVTESGHDGRVGGEEFVKAAAGLSGAAPAGIQVNPESFSLNEVVKEIGTTKPEALVLWTGSAISTQLLPAIRKTLPSTSIYLCQKAGDFMPQKGRQSGDLPGLVWTIGLDEESPEFLNEYHQATGETAGIAAQQMHDAVRAIAEAVRHAGTNRTRVRDRLATVSPADGEVGGVSFDSAGNLKRKGCLMSVEIPPVSELPAAAN
jgi:branched-chain amino acid transport system substrate-binding protein